MTKRIRIERVDEIDFTRDDVVKLLAKGYAVILKDKDAKSKCSQQEVNKES